MPTESLRRFDYKSVMLIGLSHASQDAQMIRGMCRYYHMHEPWQINNFGHLREGFDHWLGKRHEWVMHGIFANITDPAFGQRLLDTGLPLVDVSGLATDPRYPSVLIDNVEVGREAARYLLARGFTRFAYYSQGQLRYEVDRWRGFAEVIAEAGRDACWVLDYPTVRAEEVVGRNPLAGHTELHSRRWIDLIEKPCALLVSEDRLALTFTDVCRNMGIAVPEQVAILGVDNTPAICESCYPTLSSVITPGEQIGYEAAKLLDQMMDGQSVAPPKALGPLGVETRRSTDVMAIEDQVMAQALSFLREQSRHRIVITEVARYCNISRRALEERFQKTIGRSPQQELFRLRVEHAKQRLLHTDASIYTTAIESGFSTAESMATHFKRWAGVTPTAFRKRNRPQ